MIYGQPIYNLQVKCMNKTTWNGIDETRASEYEKMIDGSSKFRRCTRYIDSGTPRRATNCHPVLFRFVHAGSRFPFRPPRHLSCRRIKLLYKNVKGFRSVPFSRQENGKPGCERAGERNKDEP